jgi:hypothetical protein
MSLTRGKDNTDRPENDCDARPSPPAHQPELRQSNSTSTPRIDRPRQSRKIYNPYAAQKNRPKGALRFFRDNDNTKPKTTKSFHVVKPAIVLKNGERRFFKLNTKGSVMSELEAAGWSLYHIIAPQLVSAKANAHYNCNGDYIGVSSTEIQGFESLIDNPLTEEDLENEEIVSGLAVSLAMSYFFEEDDMHRGNMSKYGQRIDFDMTLWPVFAHYKTVSLADWSLRPYTQETFVITARDIDNFPDIKDANPYYWPTKLRSLAPEEVRKRFSGYIPASVNAYRSAESLVFQKLADPKYNKHYDKFVYHKFKTLLKCLLISTHNYNHLISQHVRSDLQNTDPALPRKKITDIITDHLDNRKKEMREVLLGMPSFQNFMFEHGKQAFAEIKAELEARNEHLESEEARKWNKHNDRSIELLLNGLVHIEEMQLEFDDIFTEAKNIACNALHAAINR